MPERAVIADLIEVDPVLRTMELDRETLLAVIAYADAERALCTSNDVKGFNLITMHDKAARGLREKFAGSRWEKDETDNQAGIRHPILKLRVIPCNFDDNAGNPDKQVTPRPRHLKGGASRKKIRCNQTGWLPGLDLPPVRDEYETWVLGIFADDETRSAELSLPLSFIGGQFSDFQTRIILDTGAHDNGAAARKSPEGEAPTEIVNIPIKRK
ncbi:hypothetical protein [Sphingomonas sp.]|uniref:hypothetical protein n=1 Tax=Sphingomonas sp. TaxID=28214 RepID=UPI0037516926